MQGCRCRAVSTCSRNTSRPRLFVTCKSSQPAPRRRARRPGFFEVTKINPPPHSLGIHPLPPDTHNGDQIEVDGADYVVSSVVLQYKLVCGRYQREHNRLEVQQTGRYFLNLHLQSLLDKPDSNAASWKQETPKYVGRIHPFVGTPFSDNFSQGSA